MSKIYAFLILVPFIALLFFKGVLFYEYDTKERYIKDLTDSIAYKVKITGVLTPDEYNEFKTKLGTLWKFDDLNGSILLKRGRYVDGTVTDWSAYTPNTQLGKGEAFLVYVKSSQPSNYSKLQNGGVDPDPSKNLYYVAKAQCRVEYDN